MTKKEECGVFGARSFNGEDISVTIYNALLSLQHRGQEATGISTLNDKEIQVKKSLGLVSSSFSPNTLRDLKGGMGIGHVRYSTVGTCTVKDAQPFRLHYPKKGVVLAHNGNLVNYVKLRNDLSGNGRHFTSTCDAEIIAHKLAEGIVQTKDIEKAIYQSMEDMEGAYSAGFFTGEKDLIIFRDPYGIRPFCYGKNSDKVMFSSESVALNMNDVYDVHDVKPGEMIIFHEDGKIEKRQVMKGQRKHCMFEYVYFSRPDSVIEGKSVYDVRIELGKNMARGNKVEGDIIVPVPDTSRSAAEGMSRECGIPVAEGLMKNRYVHRTFITPEQSTRSNMVSMKLNPVISVLKDKHVILVDDSIVRGTTMKKIVNMVRKAGAKRVDLYITCPPIISPCFYGVDIATHGELIAHHHDVEGIRKEIGA
ncbi:MAG: amidophosphoribosyltransferase, partial [Candidatus Aenigmarchaeota archaeon]|nr:amidophosphoribosyltransferase [Candidatus Aenigmarchaeota archaeon]